jgi:magnesium transporter
MASEQSDHDANRTGDPPADAPAAKRTDSTPEEGWGHRLRRQRRRHVYQPPGTLFSPEARRQGGKTSIRVMQFDEEGGREWQSTRYDSLAEIPRDDKVSWITVNGVSDGKLMESLGKQFPIHPLVLEDVMDVSQRPKLEDHDQSMFVILDHLDYDEQDHQLTVRQVSLILLDNVLLCFQEEGDDQFEPIRERIRNNRGRIRSMGADYLLYSVLDMLVDGYYLVFESIGDRVDDLETQMSHRPSGKMLQAIHRLRRQAIHVRKSVWPLREMMNSLARHDVHLLGEETSLYLRDLHDHTLQVIESSETLRDVLASVLEMYMSSISNRMNAVMKVLTMIATIFIPLSFIAGVYGMNFQDMPGLNWAWGFWVTLGGMAAIAGVMVALFWKRGWL